MSRFRLLCASRAEAAGLALLLFVLMAHWLVALVKPEISADRTSMHLALPMEVAHEGRWAFDFQQYTWALILAWAAIRSSPRRICWAARTQARSRKCASHELRSARLDGRDDCPGLAPMAARRAAHFSWRHCLLRSCRWSNW